MSRGAVTLQDYKARKASTSRLGGQYVSLDIADSDRKPFRSEEVQLTYNQRHWVEVGGQGLQRSTDIRGRRWDRTCCRVPCTMLLLKMVVFTLILIYLAVSYFEQLAANIARDYLHVKAAAGCVLRLNFLPGGQTSSGRWFNLLTAVVCCLGNISGSSSEHFYQPHSSYTNNSPSQCSSAR